ncbi:uncharacterized protein LOC133887350 [Phragmites australis]|uniref:uncharacterized protein LOC133887350 n=1 Tax=Phragmites australis TaxID=29695 RepID=UPI002D76BE01|nr:uncharacterized protein LOC133887350 [Phragmites australis]
MPPSSGANAPSSHERTDGPSSGTGGLPSSRKGTEDLSSGAGGPLPTPPRMGGEVWTLVLHCDRGSETSIVNKEMDRDLVCYFNLMRWVESLSFTAQDFFFYPKRDLQ